MSNFALLADTSTRVGATTRRTQKVLEISRCLRQLAEHEVRIATFYLSGELPQGKIGVGFALLRTCRDVPPIDTPELTLARVDEMLSRFAVTKGAGSTTIKAKILSELFAAATAAEQEFLLKILSGELRQGALAGIMTEAIAIAASLPIEEVRRAAMYAPSLADVALTALHREREHLLKFKLETLSPVMPMLADTAVDVEEALEQSSGPIALEWKIDGARIQVHKRNNEVRIYTRNLHDVAPSVPEVVEAVQAIPAKEIVLDGEVVALDKSGRPLPFQMTMRRFGRKLNVETLRESLPLSCFFFDCLRLKDRSLADRPYRERIEALESVVPDSQRITRLVTDNIEAAHEFYEDALAKGHEGIMAKSLDSPYEAGKRGSSWLKIKRAHTLDLVVLAAEWGNGRRTGKLSNLHLGARDPKSGAFVMLGKTFKGLTDTMLEWQTNEFLAREIKRDAITVYVRPELVVEIAFSDIQASTQYPGGFALRFARVKRYRDDKRAEDADSIDTIRTIFNGQSGVETR